MVVQTGDIQTFSLRAEFERDEAGGIWFGMLSVGVGGCWYRGEAPELLNASFVIIASWCTRESDPELFAAIEPLSARHALITALRSGSNYSFAESPSVKPDLTLWLQEALEAPFGLELGPETAMLIVRGGDVVRVCVGKIRDADPFATLEDVSELRLAFEQFRQIVRDFVERVPPLAGITLVA